MAIDPLPRRDYLHDGRARAICKYSWVCGAAGHLRDVVSADGYDQRFESHSGRAVNIEIYVTRS